MSENILGHNIVDLHGRSLSKRRKLKTHPEPAFLLMGPEEKAKPRRQSRLMLAEREHDEIPFVASRLRLVIVPKNRAVVDFVSDGVVRNQRWQVSRKEYLCRDYEGKE